MESSKSVIFPVGCVGLKCKLEWSLLHKIEIQVAFEIVFCMIAVHSPDFNFRSIYLAIT